MRGLNLAVNVGIPKTSWKLQQQVGRIGREGEQSMCISMIFPQTGSQAPEPVLRNIMKGKECQRRALNDLFTLSDPLVDYTKELVINECTDDCAVMQTCQCSYCYCCSVCSDSCDCKYSSQDENTVMENILGFGDESYRY